MNTKITLKNITKDNKTTKVPYEHKIKSNKNTTKIIMKNPPWFRNNKEGRTRQKFKQTNKHEDGEEEE